MLKDFFKWNKQKEKINEASNQIFFKEREIWWIALGLNIGYEQDGKGESFNRPVLILNKFNRNLAFVVPMTTVRKLNKYYVECLANDGVFRMAMISQVRVIDSRRFVKKMTTVTEKSFFEIKSAVKGML